MTEVLKEEGTGPANQSDWTTNLFRNAVSQAEGQVGALVARLEELRNGNRPEEIEQARKNLPQPRPRGKTPRPSSRGSND